MLDIIPKDYPDFYEFGETPCSQTNPDAFIADDPVEGNLLNRIVYTYEVEAKTICSTCPYQQRCLQYALDNPGINGIWGMSNERQRQRIRRGENVTLGIPARRHV